MSRAGDGVPVHPKGGDEVYRFFFDWNPQPMWVWDVENLHFLAANEAAIRHYGYSRDEFLAMKFGDIRAPKDSSRLPKDLLKFPTFFDPPEICSCRRKDGTLIEVEIRCQSIDWTGSPAHLVAAHDVTDHKLAELALRESEERVRLILASAAEAIFGCDRVGTCMFCNDAAAHILGFDDPAELLGKNMHTTEHHTRADGTPYPLEECPIYVGFQKGQGTHRDDEIFWRKDGTSFPVEYWSHLMVQEGRALCVVAFMDITERRQGEEALRKSEERWRAVFDNSAIGVALTDLCGRFIAVNRAYEKMVGYTEEELRKLAFLDITHEDDAALNRELITELLEGKRKQLQIEKQYRRKDGSLMWVSNNVSLVPGTESMPRFLMALSEDITERKRAEEALRRSVERARTLLEINNAVITNLVQETLLRSISGAIHRAVPYDAMALTLREPETDTFRIMSVEGIHQYFQAGQQIEHRGSSLGWVFDHQRPLLRSNLEAEQRFSNDAQLVAEGMQSHCVVPLIIHGGKSTGTLSVTSKRRVQYSEKDAEFLQEVANQLLWRWRT